LAGSELINNVVVVLLLGCQKSSIAGIVKIVGVVDPCVARATYDFSI
jgi:hypothetical protein